MLISRTFKTLLSKATAAPTYAFSSHDEPPPTSLPKVSEVVYSPSNLASTCTSETNSM